MSSSNYANLVQELYIAYLGRPADAAGLSSLENTLASFNAPTDIVSLAQDYAGNPAVENVINSFGNSTESAKLYGTLDSSMSSIDAFVTSVFEHVLNRAPASSGLNFWANEIASGTLSPGDAALSIASGALVNQTTQGKLDAALINAKVAAAETFTGDMSNATGLAAYQGATAAAEGRQFLAGITTTTTTSDITSTISGASVSISTAASTTLSTVTVNPNGTTTGTIAFTPATITIGSVTEPIFISLEPHGGAVSAIITGLVNTGIESIVFAGDQNNLQGFTQVTAVNLSAAGLDPGALSNWIAVADGAAGSGITGPAHSLTWFQFQNNTYLIESLAGPTADAGVMAAGNTVIELTGTSYTFAHSTGLGGTLHMLG